MSTYQLQKDFDSQLSLSSSRSTDRKYSKEKGVLFIIYNITVIVVGAWSKMKGTYSLSTHIYGFRSSDASLLLFDSV